MADKTYRKWRRPESFRAGAQAGVSPEGRPVLPPRLGGSGHHEGARWTRRMNDVKLGALCWNQYTDWPSLLEAGKGTRPRTPSRPRRAP
jgi:hypothetical protein